MHRCPLLLAALLAALALGAPMAAAADVRAQSSAGSPVVVVSGDVEVAAGEAVRGVYVANGDVRVDGRVEGDVVVFTGDILVAGSVEGNVVTVDGRARLLRSARVSGDVRYADQHPAVSGLARVSGNVTNAGWSDGLDVLPFLGGFLIWLGVGISTLLLGGFGILIAPRAADRLEARARGRVGPLLAIGLAIAILLPLVAGLAAITLVGIPLAVGILLALAPLWATAYAVSAFALGRRLVAAPRHRLLSLLAGVALLRAAALVPVAGLVVGVAAVVFGLGLIGAAIGAARSPQAGPGEEPRPGPARSPGS